MKTLYILGTVLLFLTACTRLQATVSLQPTQGSQAVGTVVFTKTSQGIHVNLEAEHLSAGKHAFHIHEYGNCSVPNASSAGSHFNPASKSHGEPSADSHLGDLGNIEADSNGRISYEFTYVHLTDLSSIRGKSVILHAQEDDYVTQPSGNAGTRLACGVIR